MYITLQFLHTVCTFSVQSITYKQKIPIMFHVRSITSQQVNVDIALHHEMDQRRFYSIKPNVLHQMITNLITSVPFPEHLEKNTSNDKFLNQN